MKKTVLLIIALILSINVIAQNDVTKFLGIPVDGFKSDMIKKLQAKGYVYDSYNDCLTGEFNGTDVIICVVTNNNKVYRIAVFDKNYTTETNIKIRFNTLCRQFENNSKYTSLEDDQKIAEDVDISIEMNVHDKRIQASYYQKPEVSDKNNFSEDLKNKMLEKYSQEEIDNMNEDSKKELIDDMFIYIFDKCFNKSVWFMIEEKYGKYRILMYYDNLDNQANGEDL